MNRVLDVVGRYRKAIGGGVAAVDLSLLTMYPHNVAVVLVTAFLTGSGVAGTLPNKTKPKP